MKSLLWNQITHSQVNTQQLQRENSVVPGHVMIERDLCASLAGRSNFPSMSKCGVARAALLCTSAPSDLQSFLLNLFWLSLSLFLSFKTGQEMNLKILVSSEFNSFWLLSYMDFSIYVALHKNRRVGDSRVRVYTGASACSFSNEITCHNSYLLVIKQMELSHWGICIVNLDHRVKFSNSVFRLFASLQRIMK